MLDSQELQTLSDLTRGAGALNSEEYGFVTDAVRKQTLINRMMSHLGHPHRDTSGINYDGMSPAEARDAYLDAPFLPKEELGIYDSTIEYVRTLDADQIIKLLAIFHAYRQNKSGYPLDFDAMEANGQMGV